MPIPSVPHFALQPVEGMSTIVAWTGHRPDVFDDPSAAQAAVASTAQKLLVQAPAVQFLVGGQRGVDTWAAEAAIALGLPFSVILPLDPEAFPVDWPAADRKRLDAVLARSDEVRIVGGKNLAEAYRERNRQLAEGAEVLIAVWTQLEGGGTAETIAFARAAGIPIREIVLPLAQLAHSPAGRGI